MQTSDSLRWSDVSEGVILQLTQDKTKSEIKLGGSNLKPCNSYDDKSKHHSENKIRSYTKINYMKKKALLNDMPTEYTNL
jgi:hypothetical protein